MLTSSRAGGKMTGLELGLGSAASSLTSTASSSSSASSAMMASDKNSNRTLSSSSDEMLTTPKVPDSALLSPRVGIGDFPTPKAANSSKMCGDMLTTPKPLDLGFSPGGLRSSPSAIDTGPRVPPEDLPLGPEIGLRSPCDGLLAKRRREYRNNKLADKSNSVNSDSNSCDTPNSSQNSPRDYTLVKNGDSHDGPTGTQLSPRLSNKVQVKLEFQNQTSARSSATSPSNIKSEHMDTSEDNAVCGYNSVAGPVSSPLSSVFPAASLAVNTKINSLRPAMGGSNPSSPSALGASFKLPSSKADRLSTSSSSSSSVKTDTDMPARLPIPSPLIMPKDLIAMPSPNWSAVERKMQEVKTPRNLSAEIFDFLGPPPITPRNKLSSTGRDNSPSHLHGQKLSPSPRDNIPVMPTDLRITTGGDRCSPSLATSRLPEPSTYPVEAEDLSMGSSNKAASISPPNSNSTPTPPLSVSVSSSTQVSSSSSGLHLPQVKQEYTPPDDPMDSRSRHSSASGLGNEAQVKMEASDDYEPPYRPSSFGPPPPSSSAPPFYLQTASAGGPPGQFNPTSAAAIYQRINLGHQPANVNRYEPGCAPVPQYPPPLAWASGGVSSLAGPGRGAVGVSGGGASTTWQDHDEEASMSPPMYHQQQAQQGALNHSSPAKGLPLISVNPPGSGGDTPDGARKRGRGRGGVSASPDSGLPGQKKRQKPKTPKPSKDPGGAKRVFSCPHCQRSYDWNYNLNRHLKYECNKENAFECSKCGRKFPHKQNCVYHLKRKHKIVCDTIDQYMTAGLVIFRGTAGPTGQQQAASAARGSSD